MPPHPPHLILDALPPELQQLVLARLPPPRDDRDSLYPFLHLAEASPSLRHAVLARLAHAFVVTRRLEHPLRWAAVLAPALRDLTLHTPLAFSPPALARLLAAPNLARLALPSDPALLALLPPAPSLRHLAVSLCHPAHLRALPAALRPLRLHSLALHARADAPACPLRALPPPALAAAAPRLAALTIRCRCPGPSPHAPCHAWSVVAAFPALRRATVAEVVHWRLRQGLGPYPAHWRAPLRLAAPPAAARVSVPVDGEPEAALTFDDAVSPGPGAPDEWRLLVVEAFTGPEFASDYVPLVVSVAPARLRALALDWGPLVPADDHASHGRYAERFGGTLVAAVQSLPALRELCLMRVRMPFADLEAILALVGNRLTVLGTAIERQEEPADERLVSVLHTVYERNPALLELGLDFAAVAKYALKMKGELHRESAEGLKGAISRIYVNSPQFNVVDYRTRESWSADSISKLFLG